jgi:putative oxidoreductase
MTTASMSTLPTPETRSRALHVALWVVQGLLAVAFAMGGLMKVATPIVELAQKMPWVADVPEALVRFIGVAELSGALGLILPAATRVKPILTPVAGAGLVLVMVLASAFHLSRGEPQVLPINFVLGGLAAFVAWGRLRKAPIAPRG